MIIVNNSPQQVIRGFKYMYMYLICKMNVQVIDKVQSGNNYHVRIIHIDEVQSGKIMYIHTCITDSLNNPGKQPKRAAKNGYGK